MTARRRHEASARTYGWDTVEPPSRLYAGGGGAAVRRCEAIARSYGWDTVEPPVTQKTAGAALFRFRIAAQEGLRQVFALCGHGAGIADERLGGDAE